LVTFARMQPSREPDRPLGQCNLGHFCGVLAHPAPEAESPGQILQLHAPYGTGLALEYSAMTLPRLLLAFVVSAAVALAAAACSKSDTSPTTTTTSTNCSVTLGSATTSVSAAATSGTIAVTAASTC